MSKIKIGSNKSFGIVFFIFFICVSLYPLIYDNNLRVWALLVAILFLILGLINSQILTPLNILWFKIGIFLGKFVSPVIMGIIFFIIVTPTGILMRLFKKDILNLKKSNKKTYWIKRSEYKSKMKDQF